MKITVLSIVLLLVLVVAVLFVVPAPIECVQCPKASDGSCSGSVMCAAPGHPELLGWCQTVTKSNGRLDCQCSL
jgi:hypothetical protein